MDEMASEQNTIGETVLMTAGEVGALLGVPASWVYEQSRLGRIPTVTLGRYRRYRRAAIEAWVGELEARPHRVRA
jgi:excisionase family DNA binding protein